MLITYLLKKAKKPADYWLKKNYYYHEQIKNFYKFIVPTNKKVLLIGCNNSYILSTVKPSYAIYVDSLETGCTVAQQTTQFKAYTAVTQLKAEQFDYIIISQALMSENTIEQFFEKLDIFCSSDTKIIIEWYNIAWRPLIALSQALGLSEPVTYQNWFRKKNYKYFLYLADYESISSENYMYFPFYIPVLSWFINKFLQVLPIVNNLSLQSVIIARPKKKRDHTSVSIIIPCKNEAGNIESAIICCPNLGTSTEFIFVEGNSQDNTHQEIKRVIQAYPDKTIKILTQEGQGKADAVRKGFAHAQGNILMILDADLTVKPEELHYFYQALINNKGDFINGCRLIYSMESQAMQFLNVLANYFFAFLFSWLLNQKMGDTLCGTKVLYKKDYEALAQNRTFFGDFDPFGDFDLLFGAAKLNLKIIDLPVHYKRRTYGTTQIRRFYHGLLLLNMSLYAFLKFKLK